MQTSIPMQKADLNHQRRHVTALLQQNRLQEAEHTCHALINDFPEMPDGWVFRARIAQRQNDFVGAAAHMQKATSLAPDRLDVRLILAESAIYTGHIAEAISTLQVIESDPSADEDILRRLSGLYTQLGRHEAAYRTAVKAREKKPASINFTYLVASTAIAVGKIDEADDLLNKLIAATPEEGDTYYNRATLKKQTTQSNHIDQIRQRIAHSKPGDHRLAPLYYALGKELEDLGEHKEAFNAFAEGAKARKALLSYDVSVDQQAADAIIETFTSEWRDQAPGEDKSDGPIFVLGLPRSGTTLVDRILSAHSQVMSLGEVNDVAYSVVRAGFPAADKSDLIKRSAQTDMQQLGQEIWQAFRGYGETAPYLIDKTPANYLYLGLIAKALPNAKIIHLRRHPLASGYAMFKTLFRMGYPFSYDLEDIAHYYIGYHRLMQHWQELFPGRILDIQYEELVDTQEELSRAIIAHCDLDWEGACLHFHQNKAPTATASAAQVRRPLYRDARDLWRQHAAALRPLATILEKAGIPCD